MKYIKILVLSSSVFLTACVAGKSQLATVEDNLNQVSEKVDSLVSYSNTTQDMLMDLDLRMDTLEVDARKRGVPTRVKGVDIANNTAPKPYSVTVPQVNKANSPNSPKVNKPEVDKPKPVQNNKQNLPNDKNNVSPDRKISDEHYLPEGMTYGNTETASNTLQFPKGTITDKTVDETKNNAPNKQPEQQVGSITGQNLTKIGNNQDVKPESKAATNDKSPKLPSVSQHTPSAANYDVALSLYNQRKFSDAEKAFDAFLKANPQGVLAPNALYWKGETYYARGDYPNAIFSFKEVQTRYPTHPKAADSLLKTGMSYQKLGDANNANLHYSVLKEDFPNSSAAKRVPN